MVRGFQIRGAWVRFPPNLGYVSTQMYFDVFCCILHVSEQSHVSVRVEEAFQIHAKKDRYVKENPHLSVMYRSSDTPVRVSGIAGPVHGPVYRSGDTWTPSIHRDTCKYTCKYMRIHTNTCECIHTHTYMYVSVMYWSCIGHVSVMY